VSFADADDALPTLEGRALGFGLLLAADQILDPSVAGLPASEARGRLFAAIDPDLAARVGAGDVIVAEEIHDPSGAAHTALSVLAMAGVVALVAKRFAATVRDAAAAAGIVPLVVDTPSMLRTGDRVRLDLDAAKVVDLSSGDRVAIRNASSAVDRALLRAALARAAE
jgi:3-isopropylmalate dehydratase small subunit